MFKTIAMNYSETSEMKFSRIFSWHWDNVIYIDGYKMEYGVVFIYILYLLAGNDFEGVVLLPDKIMQPTAIRPKIYYPSMDWLAENGLISFQTCGPQHQFTCVNLGDKLTDFSNDHFQKP